MDLWKSVVVAAMTAKYPFVGREDVLGELRAALDRAAAGRGGLVTLTGPAGAGKTRTAEEATERAEGFRTLWTWCPPQTAARAFRPWSRLVRELVADDAACGRLVTASPPLRALVAGAGPGALRGADPEAARLRLTGDLTDLLATAARPRPLLLVLDDLHAADASSLRLLLETSDATRTLPVLLLTTTREEGVVRRNRRRDAGDGKGDGGGAGREVEGEQGSRARAGGAGWEERGWVWGQLLRRGRVLRVGPLGERDVAELVEAVTGTAPEADALRSFVQRTGGEAFFVTESLRAGSWSVPPAVDGTGASSVTVRAAVEERLADLSPRAARVLDVAAVLGTRFRLDVLAETAEVPLAEVRALLGEAAEAGLSAGAAVDRGAFRHDLLRDAVYDTLTPADRSVLHHTAADVLAGYARRGRDTGPAEVAHHLFLAGPEHAPRAARFAREAAARAEALYAFEDAARWYERAVEAWGHGAVETDENEGPSPGERAEFAEVLIGLGTARFGAGEPGAAREALLRAARVARQLGRGDLLARAALGLGTGPVGFEVDLSDREQVDLLVEARDAVAGEPAHAGLRAAVTARLSLAGGLVETEAHRVALAEEAVRLAEETGDPAVLGPALAALCDALSGPDHCRDRLAWSARIVTTARDLRDPVLELLGRRLRLVALTETGAFAAADAEVTAYEAVVRPLRRPLYAWYVPLWRGSRALMEGRYDDCAAALDEVEALGREAGSANAALLAGTQRWCLYTDTGDLDGVTRLLAVMPPLDRLPGLWPLVSLALLAAQFGRLEEAARRLSAVAPHLGTAPRDSEWLPMVAQAAETVAATGSHPCASALYDLLAPYAGLYVVEGIGAAVRGPVDRHLALLAAAMGDDRRAHAHREAALRSAEATGALTVADRIRGETGEGSAGARARRTGDEEADGEGAAGAWARRTGDEEADGEGAASAGARARRTGGEEAGGARGAASVGDGARGGVSGVGTVEEVMGGASGGMMADAAGGASAEGAVDDAAGVVSGGAVDDAAGGTPGGGAVEGAGGGASASGVFGGGVVDEAISDTSGGGVADAAGGASAGGAVDDAAGGTPGGGAVEGAGRGASASGGVEGAVSGASVGGAVAGVSRTPPREVPPHPSRDAQPHPPRDAVPPAPPVTPLFHREGPLWHLRYAGRDVRIPDSKGLHDIAVLLARPGTPVPAVELASPGVSEAVGERSAGLHAEGDTGEVIDATARTAYRRRLRELEEEARDADAAGDADHSARIAVERDALVAQLAAAYGIGGRVRRTGSPAERARTAVTARVRAAVRRIGEVHPELGRHLETALRTGTLCVYRPEDPPAWEL
ncbi:AAA family ATPase [Streptomyces sp. NPDC005799]|uniref:ATP-binding protein n=1 Tax=Streptomyces sp. NPDC005799 TaxID=3154678 RepID=UPI0033CB439E